MSRTTPIYFVLLHVFAAVIASGTWAGDDAKATAGEKRTIPISLKNDNTVNTEFRVGPGRKMGIAFKFTDGKIQSLDGTIRADVLTRQAEKDGKKVSENTPLDDAFIEFKGAGLFFRFHSRPNLARYTPAQQNDLAATWATLPAASERFIALEIRADEHGAELWLEGRYCGRINSESRLAEVNCKLEAGAEVRNVRTWTRPDHALFLPLDARRIARPGGAGVGGAMKEAVITLKPGLQQIKNVPMIVAPGGESADVGAAKEMQGLRYLETDENTSRTSLDGMPESLHFSVPQEFYRRAWVLCAVEPDAKKEPVLTARLTRFGTSGRGGAIADTSVTLPGGNGVETVGSVEYKAADGRAITAPLYLVKMELKAGEILDLLADRQDPFAAMKIGPYLDFEFLGKLDGIYVQTDRRHKPARNSTSAVHVFGVTLEKSPVELRLKQSQPGNIFHNDEVPETTFALSANAPGKYTISWSISEVDGRDAGGDQRAVEFTAVGKTVDINVPLVTPNPGWYRLRVEISNQQVFVMRDGALVDISDQQVFITHDAAFAILGKDTRTAGYESPFGTWWFGGAHYSARELKVAGPLLFKAGMRRTTTGWTKDSEADFAPWKISTNQFGWAFRLKDLDDWDAAVARVEKQTQELIKRFPHCRYVDIFHESFDNATVPPELYGEKPPVLTPEKDKQEKRFVELGIKAAKFYREKFPQLKLVFGNSGGSSTIIGMLLRQGFPREYIDYLGSETTGQTIAPEKLSVHTTMGIWMLRETARKFRHEIPLTGCFEFTCRAERDLGAQRQAEWYSKDVMIGLAYRFPTVSPAVIADVGNAYYETLWGASGLCQRNPLHYPKPAYVALATLTKALDSARLVRQMPTGSSSAYALEFERGNERIYALWTPRGNCEMHFEFPEDTAVSHVAFYGKQSALKSAGRTLDVTASSAVTYVTSPIPASAVTAGRRTFPRNQPPPQAVVVSHVDDVKQWSLSPDDQTLKQATRRPGRFALRQANDPEKGACLELELERQGEVPDLIGEYAAIQLKQPAPVPGRPHTAGVWIRGDSSWGRVFFEFEDSKGERWRSSRGTNDGDDWGNQSTIDFDGWCFVTVPITDASPARHIEPAGGAGMWEHRGGDGKLDYPLKLTSITVLTHRKSVDLTEMRPVKGAIRLKDVSVFGE